MAWASVGVAVVGGIVSMLGSKRKKVKYRPNPSWLHMKESVAAGIREGIELGGYTYSDETADILKRQASLDIARQYTGVEADIKASLAPYGNIGAMGRGFVGLATAEATEKARARMDIDMTQETQKLASYHQLIGQGSAMQDPNLPQLGASLANQQNVLPTSARLGTALGEGAAAGLNMWSYNQSMNRLGDGDNGGTQLGGGYLSPPQFSGAGAGLNTLNYRPQTYTYGRG